LGFMTSESLDKSQSIAAGGITSLAAAITVPHVAEQTNQWYTRAVLVNVSEASRALDFSDGHDLTEITSQAAANSQQDFRFSEAFTTVPSWGVFTARDNEATLAGMELFGRVDGANQMAALEMSYQRLGNPNFVNIDKTIYFPHVASDTVNFWTGIALINPTNLDGPVLLTAYDGNGDVVVTQSLTVGAQTKFLSTISDLFPQVQGIAWLKAEADFELDGFELFGDHQSTRLAGFEAAKFATDTLYFPNIDVLPGEKWTGIAVLNIGDQVANLTVTAFDANGAIVGEATHIVGPRSKLVETAENLFNNAQLPPGTQYIKVTADQKTLNGFQLNGSLHTDGSLGEQMSGMLALIK